MMATSPSNSAGGRGSTGRVSSWMPSAVRQARMAWSSNATGAPNTAMTDVATVLGAGGLVGTGQVVDVIGTPAGDGVAVVGGLPGAPDLKGLGRADPVGQLLEVDGFGVVVERQAGLLAVERIEHCGVAAAVLAVTDPE